MRPFAVLLDVAALADFCDFLEAYCFGTHDKLFEVQSFGHIFNRNAQISSACMRFDFKRKILCDILRPKYFSDEDSHCSTLFSGESNSLLISEAPLKNLTPCKEKGCIVQIIHTSWVITTKIVDVPRSWYGVAVKILKSEWSRSARRYDQERTFPFTL